MKKSKGQTIDLLYTNKKEIKKTKQKVSKKNKKVKPKNTKNEGINLDNEIIIGLTLKKEKDKNKTKEKSQKTKKNLQKKKSKQPQKRNSGNSFNKNKQKKRKNNKKLKIIKWTTIIILSIVAIIMFMMSSVFNIKKIVVSNNDKISSEEIVNLSKIPIGTNMFKITKRNIKNNIKTNPYIDTVKIRKSLNGTITLEVKERTATYMLKHGDSYVYINNQGYMLEISDTLLELPIITGFETPEEEIKAGNRLIVSDLEKLEDVIKIRESAKTTSLSNIITEIDISDSTNYKLTIVSEGKTVQFGDITDANIKLLKIEGIIEQEKGIAGEIYFQDSEKTVFRETVNF